MAKRYAKFKALEFTYENRAVDALTEQKWNESLFIVRGKDDGIFAWHYILVPHHKINQLKSQKSGQTIDCTKFGTLIQYRDQNGQIHPSSGWGIDPPRSFQTWIENNYGHSSFDENTILEYSKDDIRLCTMQRLNPSQLIGICRYYNKQAHFHYVKLFDNCETSLAYRSGIRNSDRFICLNGINIQNETLDQITKRFQNELHLPIQMLVCNPSTYHHYKSNNQIIHQDLPSVQHLKPVFDISLSNQNPSSADIHQHFCVMLWENNDQICVVSQSSIFKSSDLIEINDICFIELDGKYQRGIIKYIGSKDQCQNIQNHLIKQTNSIFVDKYYSNNNINKQIKIFDQISLFEDLPNEYFYDLFDYLTIEELHYSFFNLNYRFNQLLFSRSNLSFIYDQNIHPLTLQFYRCKINHLTIDTNNYCDLNLFPNINSLIILNRNLNNIKQIESELFPNLIYLSFKLKSDFKPPIELVDQIFSNKYKSLRYINLGWIDKPSSSKSWSICPSISFLSINCSQLTIIEDILISCPNLNNLQIDILYNSNISINSSSNSVFSHPIKRFTLWGEGFYLTFDLINNLINLMPNLEYLYIQSKCRIRFLSFIENLFKRLNNLIKFDCFIKELLMKNERIGNLNDIQNINLCFKRIKLIKENENCRIFATD